MPIKLTQEERIARAMSEAELSTCVKNLALAFNYLAYHTWMSKHSQKGFPDWTFVKDGRLIFAELKKQLKKPEREQQQWLDEINKCHGVEAYCWRPSDWLDGTICKILS